MIWWWKQLLNRKKTMKEWLAEVRVLLSAHVSTSLIWPCFTLLAKYDFLLVLCTRRFTVKRLHLHMNPWQQLEHPRPNDFIDHITEGAFSVFFSHFCTGVWLWAMIGRVFLFESLPDCDASVHKIGACPAFSDWSPGLSAVSVAIQWTWCFFYYIMFQKSSGDFLTFSVVSPLLAVIRNQAPVLSLAVTLTCSKWKWRKFSKTYIFAGPTPPY